MARTSGYSGEPLANKLGIKPGIRVRTKMAPADNFSMVDPLPKDVIREVAPPLGLVDIKVCAVEEMWSGLKLVIRRENSA